MQYNIKNAVKDDDVLVIFAQKDELSLNLNANDFFVKQKDLGNWVNSANEIEKFVNVPNVCAKQVIVAYWGEKASDWQKVGKVLGNLVIAKKYQNITLALPEQIICSKDCEIFLRSFVGGLYRFDNFKSNKENLYNLADLQINLIANQDQEFLLKQQINWLSAWQVGSFLARDLGNYPANICNPKFLAKKAKELSEQYDDLTTEILKSDQMEELGMGGVLGVGQGSKSNSRFIIMEYKPASPVNTKPYVLVGKGVTFDSGGISLKPSAGMDLMKYDMGGAAAVFGAINGLAHIKAPIHVVALIPSVENMPDGNSFRPGDILQSLSGKTIEVLNTDAEGRLILADALTYAERYNPEAVIDLATLTGACVVALGSVRCGLFGNNQQLINALFEAGERSFDRAWQMPLDDDYKEMVKYGFADLANISSVPEAGSITAAAFLSEFAQKYSWAHLDIAGVAWDKGAGKGGTGRPIALLLEYFAKLVNS